MSTELTRSGVRRRRGRGLASRLGAVSVVMALVAAACGDSDDAETATVVPTTAAAATLAAVTAPEIPSSTVNMAIYPCCADQSHYVIGLEKGWFADVGMEIDGGEFHLYTLFDQIVPSMQRGDFDVAGIFVQGYLQTLDTFGNDVPPIFFTATYVGYSILKSPGSDAKTTEDFMAEGMSFRDAAAAAVSQLEGKEVYTPPHGQVQPPYPDVFMSYAGLSYPDDLDLQFLEDVKIVEVAAQEGRIEFAIPYAAPVLVQMIREGWEPVINTVQTLNDVGSAQAERMTKLVGSSGLFAQRSWVDADRDRALRLLSVTFRILEYLDSSATQHDGWVIQADLMNASQGLSLIPEDVGVIWDSIDPMWKWEDQGPQLWDDPNAGNHVETALQTQIGALVENGTLEGPVDKYDIEAFLVAKSLFNELRDLQHEADALFAEANGADVEVGRGAVGVIAAAQTHYDNYNFVDAVRFLKAALGK